MKVLALLIFLVSAVIATASVVAMTDIQAAIKPRRICGSRLTRALSIMCHSHYNKRFDPAVWREISQDRHDDDEAAGSHPMNADNDLGYWNPWVGNRQAVVPRMHFGRTRRGVADECCARYNGCTLDELRSYCYYDDDDANQNE